MTKNATPPANEDATLETEKTPICGVVMPISEIDGCSEGHWSEVFSILTEAISAAGFESNLVSNGDEVGIIQKRIIQNLYSNPIVVCDVSGKNPNVMFELGMRLAFDKPTIIIKDDRTSYSFDTSPIEHLEYPRDLRFSKIVEFKANLAEKIKATHKAATEDSSYTTFLKNFGEFKVAKLDTREVSSDEFMLEELRTIRNLLVHSSVNERKSENLRGDREGRYVLSFKNVEPIDLDNIEKDLRNLPVVHKSQRGLSKELRDCIILTLVSSSFLPWDVMHFLGVNYPEVEVTVSPLHTYKTWT